MTAICLLFTPFGRKMSIYVRLSRKPQQPVCEKGKQLFSFLK